ncbi:uncharacterized protein LOC114357082 [Ostrinia furnacalis]|uniref:uncharacterized protein LOC114357082 n=1 Tax=Ostrinia furnacalis TaxID=93504 RepID=UPI00103EA988|nr:uncharacterized protein LOC114357082 [Ostrinia furnacalis]
MLPPRLLVRARALLSTDVSLSVTAGPAMVHLHLHLLRLPTTPCMVTTAETTTWVFNPAELPVVSDGPYAHSKWPYTTVRTVPNRLARRRLCGLTTSEEPTHITINTSEDSGLNILPPVTNLVRYDSLLVTHTLKVSYSLF